MFGLMASCFNWIKNKRKPARDVKLVIIGLDDAGKSTTLASLQGEPPDGITPTVGFANANLTFGKWNVTLYDLGGGSSVRSVWQKYYAEIYGIVFTVDSSNEERISESRDALADIFDSQQVHGKPIVVLANKQDKDGALNETSITEGLELDDLAKTHDNFKFQVFPCSAIKGYGKNIDKSIKTGIEWLLKAVGENYDKLHAKVEKESAIQREKEAKERKERMERIRKLKEEREKLAKEAGVEESEDENDDDVVGGNNPFNRIQDQIELTEKHEKKQKEKKKKIKNYQANKEDKCEENEDLNEISEGTTKKKSIKKKKQKVESPEHVQHMELNPRIILEEPTPENNSESEQVNTSPKRRRSKKKKKIKTIENDENSDAFDNKFMEKAKLYEEGEGMNSHNVIYVDSAENLRRNSTRKKKTKTREENNYGDSGFERNNDNTTSFEDIHSEKVLNNSHPSYKRPSRKSEKYSSTCVNDSEETLRSVNDSRAELFQARSYDNLQERDSKNKKLNKKSSDELNKKGKKKKKKKNRTLPSFRSPPPFEDTVESTLPPLNGHLSKLEPIKSKGRLPELNPELSNSFPSWARAKPNSDDVEIFT